MITDTDETILDYAIEQAGNSNEVLVWEDDGVIWLQIDNNDPVYLEASAEAIIAYLLCGTVGTPDN